MNLSVSLVVAYLAGALTGWYISSLVYGIFFSEERK